MSAFDLDLFVIGAGSAGVRAARVAAELGARVAVAEEYRYGGTCVIRGCVPKKLMVYASAFRDAFEDAAGFGWSAAAPEFDWSKFRAAKDVEIGRLEGIYQGNLERAGARVFRSRATVLDPHRVRLATGEEFTAKHILIATGAAPMLPDIPGAELGVSSNEMFDLPELPRRALVVGGGYIACEFAGILNGLGTEVRQVYRGPRVLRGFDDDLRAHVSEAMRARGVDLRVNTDIASIARRDGALLATFTDATTRAVDLVLFATGRKPNTAGLGLEALGIDLRGDGAVPVDDWSQTVIPSVYAVGDVTARAQLTPVAIREGQAFAETVFGGRPVKPDHMLIPTAVFTQPEIGTVGLSESDARARGPVEIYRAVFRPLAHVLAGRQERMLMKLVVDATDRRVLGCHIVGHAAGEMIQLAAVAIRMGATKEDFDRTIAVHPTAAEELVTMRAPVA